MWDRNVIHTTGKGRVGGWTVDIYFSELEKSTSSEFQSSRVTELFFSNVKTESSIG